MATESAKPEIVKNNFIYVTEKERECPYCLQNDDNCFGQGYLPQ